MTAISVRPAAPRLLMTRVYATDLARTSRFYQEAFGMHVAQTVGESEVVLLFAESSGAGVVLTRPNPQTPRTNGGFVVTVPDIDVALSRGQAAGGTITRPATESGGTFRIGFITDPDGSVIEILQPPPPAAAR